MMRHGRLRQGETGQVTFVLQTGYPISGLRFGDANGAFGQASAPSGQPLVFGAVPLPGYVSWVFGVDEAGAVVNMVGNGGSDLFTHYYDFSLSGTYRWDPTAGWSYSPVPPGPAMTATVAAGILTIRIMAFKPGEIAALKIDGRQTGNSITAGADGNGVAEFTAPTPGTYAMSAEGNQGTVTSTTFTVTAPPPPPGTGGGIPWVLIVVLAALLFAGKGRR